MKRFHYFTITIVFALMLTCTGRGQTAARQNNRGTIIAIDILTYPRHERDAGSTRVRLLSAQDSTEIFSETLKGIWAPIGFNLKMNTYILAGSFERGGWLPVTTISYLNAGTLKLTESRSRGWAAFSAVPSLSMKYIAFVGSVRGNDIEDLFVLDTELDTIVRLAESPSPPPLRDENEIRIYDEQAGWDWGVPPRDGYTTMDNGIITFTGDKTLTVSYGDDKARARATQRTVKKWALATVFPKPKPTRKPKKNAKVPVTTDPPVLMEPPK